MENHKQKKKNVPSAEKSVHPSAVKLQLKSGPTTETWYQQRPLVGEIVTYGFAVELALAVEEILTQHRFPLVERSPHVGELLIGLRQFHAVVFNLKCVQTNHSSSSLLEQFYKCVLINFDKLYQPSKKPLWGCRKNMRVFAGRSFINIIIPTFGYAD